MEIRDSYKKEFLVTLRESPAWDLFISSMLSEMSFIQDDIKFMMSGAYRSFYLNSHSVTPNKLEFYNGDVIKVTKDISDVEISSSVALISNDGETWKNVETVTEQFYIKLTQYSKLADIRIDCVNFYPNMLSTSELNSHLNEYGLNREEVKFSTFGQVLSATSPYLLTYILTRANIPFSMEYFFEDDMGIQTTGSRTFTIRNGIYVRRVNGNIFSYSSDLILRKDLDYIPYQGIDYKILSVSKNMMTCEIPVGSGTFTVKRTSYIVPVLSKNKLMSYLELIFNKQDLDIADRLVKRITPVRCNQGFKGNLDIKVRGTLKLRESFSVPKVVKRVNLTVKDFISMVENMVLIAGHEEIFDSDFKVIDRPIQDQGSTKLSLV